MTVVEAAIPLPHMTGRNANSLDQDELLAALDTALEHVRFVQRAYAKATERPVRLLNRSLLPLVVPTYVGTLDQSGERPHFVDSITWAIDGSAPPSEVGLSDEELNSEALDNLLHAADYLNALGAFGTYVDLRREAMVQKFFEGNRRMTVLAAAAAGEVLLETLLLHLLWEEGSRPSDVATLFDPNGSHTLRVRRHLGHRLGGSWDDKGPSAASAYFRNLVHLRHRVVHKGYDPRPQEADAAYSALFDLEGHVGDQLSQGARLRRYPRTAMSWMGESGLRRRNRFTNFVRGLSEDPREPNWRDAFARWRALVELTREGEGEGPETGDDDLLGYATKGEDGVSWTLHDRRRLRAMRVNEEEVPPEVRDNVAEVLAQVPFEAPLAYRRVALEPFPAPTDQAWLPDYEVYEELTISPGPAD